ncbi:adenosine receptor A3-like [Mytilus galloprovincialis]|uniref:adenosine receptor A3-like n=1 Tax=Mytilus galloprovincialis TaxID=29158 RepID=UPI003F7C7A8B
MANASMSNVSEFTSNSSDYISNKTTKIHVPRDGYDLPLFGLENHHFASLHLTALSCISISLTFSVIVLTLSFRNSNHRFVCWTKSERLVVYMAICDGVFNLTHSLEHLQIYITKDHVRPRELCMFYSFVIGEFISAQMFMVNAVSINVFSMIYLGKDIHLGKYDWKLLLYTFGIPFVVHLVSAFLGKLGSTGISCHFDAIKGVDLLVFYSTMLTFIVIVVNSVLYIATWIRIYKENKELVNTLGSTAQSIKCVHKTARNMSLFVAVFFIQWFPLAVFSITALLGHIPEVIMYMAISLTNIGGVLNGMIFIIIKRRKKHHK